VGVNNSNNIRTDPSRITGVHTIPVIEGDKATFPSHGEQLAMHYTGWLKRTGLKFDSSVDRKRPFRFAIGKGEVIAGWDTGIMRMSLGETARLEISAAHGYGRKGMGPIPPDSDLIFEVQLLQIGELSMLHDMKQPTGDNYPNTDGQYPDTSNQYPDTSNQYSQDAFQSSPSQHEPQSKRAKVPSEEATGEQVEATGEQVEEATGEQVEQPIETTQATTSRGEGAGWEKSSSAAKASEEGKGGDEGKDAKPQVDAGDSSDSSADSEGKDATAGTGALSLLGAYGSASDDDDGDE
jgi:hypothetical protein